jgi:hypothetical protein
MQLAAATIPEPPSLLPAASWLENLVRPGAPEAEVRRGRRWLLLAFAIYAAVMLIAIPQGIGSSWRECDTQAISRNFLSEGFNPLRPLVDWRGDTDGAVECEFPLYQLMIATTMAAVGEAEWPGRVLALLSMLVATFSLHRLLEARVGPAGALAGALVFLSGGHAVLLGGRVMPDAMSTALALAGLTTYLRFLVTGSGSTLLLATMATMFGALAKPPALQIGLVEFLWTLTLAPRRLRELRVWLAYGTILGVVSLWLWHGRSLYQETGLTFGVVSGGDTKFPDLKHLLMPDLQLQLLKTTGRYGFSVLGALALAALIVRRRFDRVDAALLFTVTLGLLGSFRYSHTSGLGPHYHIFAAVAGAYCVARAFPARPGKMVWLLLLAAVIGQATIHVSNERAWRLTVLNNPQLPLAATVRATSTPDELVIVHGTEVAYDRSWQRRYNYEEPMMLYNSRRRGWVMAIDAVTSEGLAALHRRGARMFVDQAPDSTPADATQWLQANTELVSTQQGGRIYRLPALPEQESKSARDDH